MSLETPAHAPVRLTDADRAFLDRARLGFLTVAAADDEWPAPTPVWFEVVDDHAVQLFTSRSTRKARRLAATPRASLVAANEVGEPENWVAITGGVTIEPDGAQALAERYWDLGKPDLASVVDGWRADESLVRVVIDAERIDRYG